MTFDEHWFAKYHRGNLNSPNYLLERQRRDLQDFQRDLQGVTLIALCGPWGRFEFADPVAQAPWRFRVSHSDATEL